MNSFSPVNIALMNNIMGETAGNVPKEVQCEVCKKHKKEFKFLCRKKNKINLNCVVCNYLSKDFTDWEQHVTCESHVEKVKLYRPPQTSVEIPPPVQPVRPVQPVKPIQQFNMPPATSSNSGPQPLIPFQEMQELQLRMQEKLNEQALREILAKDRKEWNCINCNVTCQSIQSWEAHLASKKHRKNKHKFHTYPGISKEFVKRKYKNSFVRANETIGNEFIEDGVVFYCKRCDVRMDSKVQLEIHMSSNLHKLNHPIAPIPIRNTMPMPEEEDAYPDVQYNPQLFNFDNSSYGYGFRNWSAENYVFNNSYVPSTQTEVQRKYEMDQQKQLVEEAKSKLLARFPFYAINLQKPADESEIPMPVPPPESIPFPPE